MSDSSNAGDLRIRAGLPKVVSCVEIGGRDGQGAPSRLAPGRGAEHASPVEGAASPALESDRQSGEETSGR